MHNLEKLDELLALHPDSVIWEHQIGTGNIIENLQASSFHIYLSRMQEYLFFVKAGVSRLMFEAPEIFIHLLSVLGVAIFMITTHTIILKTSATLTYSFTPSYINFKWGLFIKKSVSIPYTKIRAIYHVGYDHGRYSTIFFNTSKDYNIKKWNFEEGEPRPHITFENVVNGEEVYMTVQFLWQKANRGKVHD